MKPGEHKTVQARILEYAEAIGQKKAQETSQKDIKLARKRYKELMRTQP